MIKKPLFAAAAVLAALTIAAPSARADTFEFTQPAATGRPSSGSWDWRYGWAYHLGTGTDGIQIPLTVLDNWNYRYPTSVAGFVGGYVPSWNGSNVFNPICAQFTSVDPYGGSVWSSPTDCQGSTGGNVWAHGSVYANYGWTYSYAWVTIAGYAWVTSVRAQTVQ
jgi:hypothetical protein